MIRTFLRFVLVAFGGSVLLPTITTVASLLHRNQALPLAETVLPLFIAAGLIFGALAAIIPARQAARLNIVEALRYE